MLGTSVREVANDKIAARQALKQEQADRKQSAGSLVTRGTFGSSMIEIYEAGYVRIFATSSKVPRNTPYEKLISIIFSCPNSAGSSGAATDPMQDAAVKTITTLIKGGKHLMKSTAVGLAASGISHVAKSKSGRSTLTIATDKEIHTLTNLGTSDLGFTIVRREQEDIGRSLEQAGQAVLNANNPALASSSTDSIPALPDPMDYQPLPKRAAVESSSITERMRELASLHEEGILDDAEFAVAKAKLLGTL